MTEEQRNKLRSLLDDQARRHTEHPDEARAFLLTTGIYTVDGDLAPEYGGDNPESEQNLTQFK